MPLSTVCCVCRGGLGSAYAEYSSVATAAPPAVDEQVPLLDDRELGDVLSAMLRASRINAPPLAAVLAGCAAARSAHFLALCVAYVQLRGMGAGSALPSALADGKWLPQVCRAVASAGRRRIAPRHWSA